MTVLALTTVRRGVTRGEPHGAIYLLDLEHGRAAHVVDWSRPAIDWGGYGGDRGLRGIVVEGDRVFVASSDSVLQFAPDFTLHETHCSPYLKHAQGMAVFDGRLYVASAAYDAVLALDLATGRFVWGLHLIEDEAGLRAAPFDPSGSLGPSPGNRLHLSSLFCDPRGMFIAGLRTRGLLRFDGQRIKRLVTLPEGARDVRPWRDGVLFNDSLNDAARFLTPERNRVFRTPHYPAEALSHDDCSEHVARQGFARGLCVLDADRFAAASSPLTVCVHDVASMATTQRINLDTDIRHAAHGMTAWPFDVPD
ncbi:hypothetical protein [Elongatibacter sediminis]|uniref:Uncharacterized protein n=1 Tax=Elongatibacter sediminis TaxID=3119006 RepID=A0AAW9RJH7_9GAMM